MTATRTIRAATGSEIREIVGPIEDSVLARIVAVGATREDILEAWTWLTSDDYLHQKLQHSQQGRVAQVVEILEAELPEPDRS